MHVWCVYFNKLIDWLILTWFDYCHLVFLACVRSIVISMSVCGSVCLSARISPESHARSFQIFVHVAYVRGSVLLRHVYDKPHRLSPGRGFVLYWKCVINRGRGWGCTAQATYAIYLPLSQIFQIFPTIDSLPASGLTPRTSLPDRFFWASPFFWF